jgi:hypothetical protein
VEGSVAIVVHPDDELAIKSFRNLPEVHLLLTDELNAYDVLCNDWIIFTEDTLPGAHHDRAPVAIESAPRPAKAAKAAAPEVPEVAEEVVAEQAAVDAAETEADTNSATELTEPEPES